MSASQEPAPSTEQEASLLDHGKWKLVADGSRVGFRVKKMGLYYVKGRFKDVAGEIDFAPGATSPSGELTIETASITTRMPPRDLHLRSPDFLAARKHPQIRVKAERIEPRDDGTFRASATFELHGVSEQVELTLQRRPPELRGGARQARFQVTGTLDRHDFGIKAMPPAEWVVAREVELDSELLLERAD